MATEYTYVVIKSTVDGTIHRSTWRTKPPLLANVKIDVTPEPVFDTA
jgi:hypothetical protein